MNRKLEVGVHVSRAEKVRNIMRVQILGLERRGRGLTLLATEVEATLGSSDCEKRQSKWIQ